MEYYDTLVVFSKAERIPSIEKSVYGFGIPHCELKQEVMSNKIQHYVEYLCALKKWISEGGKIDDENFSIWYDKEGNTYNYALDKEFFDNYEADAYDERPIDYMVVFNAKTSFLKDEVENDFITKNIRGLWRK